MGNSAPLAKLKGYKRTSVVHSNTSPYAAAAAMGAEMGRNQTLGPYFNVTAKRIWDTQPRATLGPFNTAMPGDVNVSFVGDWIAFLREKGLPAGGLKYDQLCTLEENTMRHLNAHRRIPIATRRTVHESRELFVPEEHMADYAALKTLISSGGDLRPYLSRHITKKKRPDKNDGLLNAWGIQHLHFRQEGTLHVLLCRITDTDAFLIQALAHDDDLWVVNTSLLQILHDNWPEEIAAGRLRGVPGETLPTYKRLALRRQNTNFATTMADGTVYLAPGGGLMASGDCSEDRRDCDKIFAELAYWQEIMKNNAARLRAALNWPASKKLSIRLIFDNRDCCFYEPTTGTRLSLNIQE